MTAQFHQRRYRRYVTRVRTPVDRGACVGVLFAHLGPNAFPIKRKNARLCNYFPAPASGPIAWLLRHTMARRLPVRGAGSAAATGASETVFAGSAVGPPAAVSGQRGGAAPPPEIGQNAKQQHKEQERHSRPPSGPGSCCHRRGHQTTLGDHQMPGQPQGEARHRAQGRRPVALQRDLRGDVLEEQVKDAAAGEHHHRAEMGGMIDEVGHS